MSALSEETFPDDGTRRSFLKRWAAAGSAALGGGALLSACGSGGGSASCVDASALTADEKQARQKFEYLRQTPIPNERCDNCMFWQPEAEERATCGGCRLFAGGVAAGGYCNSWAAAQ